MQLLLKSFSLHASLEKRQTLVLVLPSITKSFSINIKAGKENSFDPARHLFAHPKWYNSLGFDYMLAVFGKNKKHRTVGRTTSEEDGNLHMLSAAENNRKFTRCAHCCRKILFVSPVFTATGGKLQTVLNCSLCLLAPHAECSCYEFNSSFKASQVYWTRFCWLWQPQRFFARNFKIIKGERKWASQFWQTGNLVFAQFIGKLKLVFLTSLR